ncbi:MAG: hypothetical protein K1W16_10305 [Lachnospiraceae bacterium]|jgi:hypothetical protein
MALTNAFYEAVTAGNTRRVRIMMKDSLLVDPSFREFYEMEKAAAALHGLYDVHDGRAFEENKNYWDSNYMDKQMVQLIRNFSKQRIAHVKEIVRYLYPVTKASYSNAGNEGTKYTPKEREHMSYQEKKQQDQLDGSYLGPKVATGAIAGGVFGGVAASIAGVTIVGGVIVGAVVGGGTVAALNGGNK